MSPLLSPLATPFANRVNLICYGMIGFWCDYDSKTITILIPYSPPMVDQLGNPTGQDAHVVLFSEVIGGNPNHLGGNPSGSYSLSFGGAVVSAGGFGNALTLVGSSLVLYDLVNKNNHGLRINPAKDGTGVLLSISVPYPTNVSSYRLMAYPHLPYDPSGDTVGVFGLTDQNTHLLSGVSGLTYDFAAPPSSVPVTLTRYDGTSSSFQRNVAPNLLNLHLHSQPAVKAGYNNAADHILYFNRLFTYSHANASTGVLDLKSVVNMTDPNPPEPTGEDLSAMDIENLTELPWNRGGMNAKPRMMVGDPAECVQGSGS